MNEVTKKIIVLGHSGVGKTSLVNRFVFNRFADEHISTMGVSIKRQQVHLGDLTDNLYIWDIAGESNQKNTPMSYFAGANGIIYVVDLSSPASFANVTKDIAYLKTKTLDIPLLLVANKNDLFEETELEQQVAEMGLKPDLLCSAKTNEQVEFLFRQITQLMTVGL